MKTKINIMAMLMSLCSICFSQSSFDQDNVGIPGWDQSAWGFGALIGGNNNTVRNTAAGYYALASQAFGEENVAFGAYSLYNNGPGIAQQSKYNCAQGAYALYNNVIGRLNCATGFEALYSNVDGDYNTAFGSKALYSNTSGDDNTATGFEALYSNSDISGDFGNKNTAEGYKALRSNLSGDENTASGFEALRDNNGGGKNTAVGYLALSKNSSFSSVYGEYNTAVGSESLKENLSGTYNSAIGKNALFNNTTGGVNTAIGLEALYLNIDGNANTGLGVNSLYTNISGDANTAIGINALYNNTGDLNTAIGASALAGNTTGAFNVGVGYTAGANNHPNRVGDSKHTYLGTNSRITNTTAGDNLTTLGYLANNVNSSQNAVRFGNPSVQYVETQFAWIVKSDGRFKRNINAKGVAGLDFINKLRPVTYNMDYEKVYEIQLKNIPDSLKASFDKPDQIQSFLRSGFLAQEAEDAAKLTNFNFDGIHKPESEEGYFSLSYGLFVVPLVKAVQEQQIMIAEHESNIEALKKAVENYENRKAEQSKIKTMLVGDVIEITLNGVKNAQVIAIYDSSGVLVGEKEPSSARTSFKLDANGDYFIIAQTNGEIKASTKITY